MEGITHGADYFNEQWAKVQPLIDQLLLFLNDGLRALTKKKLFDHSARMAAYTITYKLGSESEDSYKDKLYQKHGEVIQSYLRDHMLPQLIDKRGNTLLKAFVERWQLFQILNKWMDHFFSYLDRYYVGYKSLPTLMNHSLAIFKNEVFDHVHGKITEAILKIVNLERVGESADVDTSVLKSCVQVYRSMDATVYADHFEEPFLEDTSRFYDKQSQNWLSVDSTPEYLIKTEKAIESEAKRVQSFMQDSTEEKARKVCAETLLKAQEGALLERENSGMRALLIQDRKDDLARVFRMFVQVDDGLPRIALMMREHIVQEGKVILEKREVELNQLEGKESSNDAAFIQSLLELHQRYQKLVEQQFQNHRDFQKELKYAFETTVNTDIGKHSNAELLSTYADSVLKTGGEEKLTDSQIEDVLEKVVSLFSFLSDKDVFADTYRGHLAKRLLNKRSASPSAETTMIQKLKLKCGAHFTSKFEGMLNDFNLGEDLEKNFLKYLETNSDKRSKVEFSCDVLTTGHWTSFKTVAPALPPVMANCIELFQEFYSGATSHRRLTWMHSLGNVIIKGTFKMSFDFQVTTLQALAMLIFNEASDGQKELSFSQVNEKLGNLEVEITKRILHSLSCQKVHVLNKTPESKKIEETDTFRVNVDFQSKIRKVRIPMASLEDTHNPQRVEEDRSMAIEAAIVRIMKARKRMAHNLLVTEVVNQLRTFKPAPKIIKKKVEHLIEREYLKRDESEPNFYQYLA